jgi:hypothetical protein
MNVEIGTEAAQFPEKEYINGIAVLNLAYCTVYREFKDFAPCCCPSSEGDKS